MHDIETREDIQSVVDAFYDKVRNDDTIGFIFIDIAKVNWEKHLPVMYDFWESMVLGTGIYKGNAMAPHFVLNEKIPLTSRHFNKWLKLFTETVDELYSGPHAADMKARARHIAGLMEFKITGGNKLKIV